MHTRTFAFPSLPLRSLAVLLALGLPVTALAEPVAVQSKPVQATQARSAPGLPASGLPGSGLWTHAGLQAATYVVLAPSLEGTPSALSPDQQKSVLSAMQRDLQGAMLRRYPGAKFVTDASTPKLSLMTA